MFTIIEYLERMDWSASMSDNKTISAIGENAKLKLTFKIAIKLKLFTAHISMTYQNTRHIIFITFRSIVKFKADML